MKTLRENLSNHPLARWLRTLKPVTCLCGPQFRRSRTIILLDLTYRCNLGCLNCDRGCRQAPSRDSLSLEQVELFLDETVRRGQIWEKIRLTGGEPTLHPQLMEIADRLVDFVSRHSPTTHLILRSNGHGEQVRRMLDKLPPSIEIISSDKESFRQLHFPVNLAPQDEMLYQWTDFANGCHIPVDTGMALNPSGYYPCGVAGAIDRIFGFGLARTSLPQHADDLSDQMRIFCGLCGHFRFWRSRVDHEAFSPSWEEALRQYHHQRPRLMLFGEKPPAV